MTVKRASVLRADRFTLYIMMVKEEKEYFIAGVLEDNGSVEEFCRSKIINDGERAQRIYDIVCRNRVFPTHFDSIMEDNV